MRFLMMAAVFGFSGVSLLAQSAPIKMGLWEKTIVSSTGEGAPTTVTAKSCITPQAWQQMIASMQKPHDGCKMNNVKTANGYSFNGTCNLPQSSSLAISGSETIQDSEHIVSESHSTATSSGKTRKFDVHSTSRFLSSSCGSVKPDDPE
jgi:Protein of unknown function (DUF3617)